MVQMRLPSISSSARNAASLALSVRQHEELAAKNRPCSPKPPSPCRLVSNRSACSRAAFFAIPKDVPTYKPICPPATDTFSIKVSPLLAGKSNSIICKGN